MTSHATAPSVAWPRSIPPRRAAQHRHHLRLPSSRRTAVGTQRFHDVDRGQASRAHRTFHRCEHCYPEPVSSASSAVFHLDVRDVVLYWPPTPSSRSQREQPPFLDDRPGLVLLRCVARAILPQRPDDEHRPLVRQQPRSPFLPFHAELQVKANPGRLHTCCHAGMSASTTSGQPKLHRAFCSPNCCLRGAMLHHRSLFVFADGSAELVTELCRDALPHFTPKLCPPLPLVNISTQASSFSLPHHCSCLLSGPHASILHCCREGVPQPPRPW